MSKQTAVEFLIDWLENSISISTYQQWLDIKDKALATEREQIIDAFGVGCQVESTRLIGYQDMASEYYNETYKGGRRMNNCTHEFSADGQFKRCLKCGVIWPTMGKEAGNE